MIAAAHYGRRIRVGEHVEHWIEGLAQPVTQIGAGPPQIEPELPPIQGPGSEVEGRRQSDLTVAAVHNAKNSRAVNLHRYGVATGITEIIPPERDRIPVRRQYRPVCEPCYSV